MPDHKSLTGDTYLSKQVLQVYQKFCYIGNLLDAAEPKHHRYSRAFKFQVRLSVGTSSVSRGRFLSSLQKSRSLAPVFVLQDAMRYGRGRVEEVGRRGLMSPLLMNEALGAYPPLVSLEHRGPVLGGVHIFHRRNPVQTVGNGSGVALENARVIHRWVANLC